VNLPVHHILLIDPLAQKFSHLFHNDVYHNKLIYRI